MEKLDLTTPNFTDENIQKLSELFPNCVTEDSNGKTIDFDTLKQELSSNIVKGSKERYQLTWPGKAESLVVANTPINKTLRPVREESKDFDNTENLYIEGDNLEVLKLLQETYLGKVKMIYIDPPYNTGKDFVYKDNFTQDKAEYDEESGNVDDEGGRLVSNPDSNGRYHSDWLSMMYPRLKLARNLLKENGVLFLSIGIEELSNSEKILNEVFGSENKVAIVSRVAKTASNLGSHFASSMDYVVTYAKDIRSLPAFKGKVDETLYKKIEKDGEKSGERYRDDIAFYQSSQKDLRPNQKYFVECPDGSMVIPPCSIQDEVMREGDGRWRWSKDTFLKKQELIVFKETKTSPLVDENGNKSKYNLYTKSYLSERQKKGTLPRDFITDYINRQGADLIKKLGIKFDFSKPTGLIKHLYEIQQDNHNDIILDFFSGSATTAHAVMQLNAEDGGNRKFIMVQIPEAIDEKSEAYKANYKTIAEIGKERIRRAGEKIKAENADKEGIEDLDTGFRVLKVDSSNMKDVHFSPDNTSQDDMFDLASNIKDDRADEDLLFMVLLDWGIDLSVKIECREVAGKTVYFADDNFLAACFEENLDENFVKALVVQQPLKVVLRDSGFASSSVKINVEQIFKQADIEVKVI